MWNEERTELTEISLFPQGCGASVPGKVALGPALLVLWLLMLLALGMLRMGHPSDKQETSVGSGHL